MKISQVFILISAILEAILGIPFLGGTIVISMGYSPLGIMFILHVITLALALREQGPKLGSIVGILTSLIAWIPFVGMVMHILTAILLFFTSYTSDAYRNRSYR
ncbi:hypothetical protein [Paenibacillus puerhi]|uniref:hypothetical protein n=1 Tax=Paenibacillus puerhi TaxID=2692622 RepID=UPI001358A7EB|nr:hypothetical protein [Paenibacillus puerhi]